MNPIARKCLDAAQILLQVLLALLLLWWLVSAAPATAATTGQTLVITPASSASSITLDLADDGTDESTSLSEIATTGDTNSIATHPTADKLLLDFSQPWLLSDQATTALSGDSATGFFPSGTLDTARLGSGTASSSTFLRGDQTWATPSSSFLTRIVTVDQGGLGDYTTISAALTYVNSQTLSASTQWLVRVGPGLYQENITVPKYVHVQGIPSVAHNDIQFTTAPVVYNLSTSGAVVTLSGGTISDLTVYILGTLTGNATGIASTANGSSAYNVTVDINSSSATHTIYGASSTAGTLSLDQVIFNQSGPTVTNTTHAIALSAGHLSIRRCWFMDLERAVPYAIRNNGSGHVVVFYTRIGFYTGSTYITDIANTSTGTIHVLASPYTTSTGTIGHPWQWRDAETSDDLTVSYTPTTPADWTDPDPTDTASALDDLAARDTTADDLSDNSITDLSDVTSISGNTTTIATTSGTLTSGNCVEVDASGNLIDAGAVCGGGGAPTFADLTSGTNTTAAMVVGSGASLKKAGTGTVDASGIDADGDGVREVVVGSGAVSFDPNDDGTANEMVLNSSAQLILSYPGYGYPFGEAMRITTTGQSLSFYQSGAGGRAQVFSTNWLSLQGANGAASIEVGRNGADTLEMMNRVVHSGSTVTCADSGDANPGAVTITPTTSFAKVTNSDANGCAVTLSESGAVDGQGVEIVVVSNAGGTVDFSDSAGISELAGVFAAGLWDSISLRYATDRWVETGRSNN